MAVARTARLLATEPLAARGRRLRWELASPDEPFGFVGGQYLIFDTGGVREDGRAIKRAYSLVSPDENQRQVETLVYEVAGGLGSPRLMALTPGAELSFSGPWGKFLPEDSQPRTTLLVASDNGITAALGLLNGRAFRPQLPSAQLIWLCDPTLAFVSVEDLRGALPGGGERFTHFHLAPPNTAARTAQFPALRGELLAGCAPDSVFLSGDGALLGSLREAMIAAGWPEHTLRSELFFNNPQKKAAA